MKITADTNVLLRLILADDEPQSLIAVETMERANLVAVSVHTLCELAWVMERLYKAARSDIAAAIRVLIEAENVVINRPMVSIPSRLSGFAACAARARESEVRLRKCDCCSASAPR